MIIYATKQMRERYRLKLPGELSLPRDILAQRVLEREGGDALFEWGAKLFYFDRRKCIQVVNFASKFTLFLFDVKMEDVEHIGNSMVQYLLFLYKRDKKMTRALRKMFAAHPLVCFDKLSDKSVIGRLNMMQRTFAQNGEGFYRFIRDGILHTREINYTVNFTWFAPVIFDGKREYLLTGEKFKEVLLARADKRRS